MGNLSGGRRTRRQVVVDEALLETAMRLTGRGRSETINAALARLAEQGARDSGRDLRAVSALGATDYPDQAVAGC